MKMKTTLLLIIFTVLNLVAINAQLILEENFDYPADRPLILDAVANSDNYDGITGWSTQSNSLAGTNCFNITNAPLTYSGYVNSGIGNAMKYTGEPGQGVFKLFSKNVRNDSTVYISFLINFPNTLVSGGDYFVGIKLEPSATSTNWGGRVFASVNPDYPGEEVSIGINKLSGGTTTWVNSATGPFFAANKTHLFVIKYKVGKLNGNSNTEEAGKFDDEMSIYVNPPTDGVEPATPLLKHVDPNQNDIYRYTSSGIVFGGARGLYFRASAVGNAPAYTIDGIRVGETWDAVVPNLSGLSNVTATDFSTYVENNQIHVTTSNFDYNGYELYSVSGQKVLNGSLKNENYTVNVSGVRTGVYILKLKSNQNAIAKIMIP